MDRRERLRRKNCEVTINDDRCEILIPSEYAEEVSTFLRELGLAVSPPWEAATGVSICRVYGETQMGAVKEAIQTWKMGDANSTEECDDPVV